MTYIRSRFLLLEWISFALWGALIGLLVAALIVLLTAGGLQHAAEGAGAALMFGPLVGSMLWFGWRVMLRMLWGQQKSAFDKVFYGACTLGLHPLFLLLLDLNARYVLTRLYRGQEPIPYTFLKPPPPTGYSVPDHPGIDVC